MNFKELETVNHKNRKEKSQNNDRLRQCKTDPESLDKSISALLSLSEETEKIANKHRDRDAFGSVGICQKGIYSLLKNPIPIYERSFFSKSR